MCQLLDIIILCPIIYLDYFWCIKYQYIYIYIKIGKEKEKEKEKGFPHLAGPEGIRPSRARARAGARAGGPLGLLAGGTTRGRRRGRGPTCQREGEADGTGGDGGSRRGGQTGRSSTAGEARDGSPPGSRFCDDGVVARHGRG